MPLRIDRCSDQQSFHQLLKVVGENDLEWRAIVRKEHLGGIKRLKKLFEQRKMKNAAKLKRVPQVEFTKISRLLFTDTLVLHAFVHKCWPSARLQ